MDENASADPASEAIAYDYYVVFGAAVRSDGSPSGTLRRRVEGAFAAGGQRPTSRYLVTGGIGRYGPSEASVMRALLLDLGVAGPQILLEERGVNTYSSAAECARILEDRRDVRSVSACSSSYHQPRCAMLLRQMGFPALRPAMPDDRPALGLRRWVYYHLREVVALPWDWLVSISPWQKSVPRSN